MIRIIAITISCIILLNSCGLIHKDETNLSKDDLIYIEKIIPLNQDEKIELFETNGGVKGLKTAGNFITNKRVASYWIDDKKDEVNYAFYNEIDSIKTIDRTKALTYSSYLEILSSSRGNFKIYIDADSTRISHFFNCALSNWKKYK